MEKSRLILVFNTLSKQELRELGKFIRSPFFNQQKNLIDFFDYLVDCRENLQIIPTKEKVFEKVFPGQKNSDVKVRLLMSDLHKLIEKYLICQATFSNKIQTKMQLAQIYRRRNLPKHFQKTIKNVDELLDQDSLRHDDYFNNKYDQLLEQQKFATTFKRTDEFKLQEITDILDVTFITKKLKQTCLLFSHQAVYKKEYDFGLLEDIIKHIEEKNLLDIPAISVFYYYYQALTQEGHLNYFQKFKNLVFLHDKKFPPQELRDLYLFAINYCIRQLNQGQINFAQEGLELYKEGLKKGFLFENKKLSRFAYNNIVAMALRVKDYDWAVEFIETYKGDLARRYRESTWMFNLARLEYERNNYDDALIYLQKADFGDLVNNLIAKTILLKIYYELGEFNLLDSHLESMKSFIRRKTASGYHQTNYLNIIRYTKKLLNTNFYDRTKKEILQKEIEGEEILTERKWLLKQVEKS